MLADEVAPTIGHIVEEASAGCIAGEAVEVVHGYAAYGPSQRSAVQPLIDHFAIPLFDDGERLKHSASYAREVRNDELGCDADGGAAALSERSQAVASALPRSLALSYYDPSRDYQAGQMRATAATGSGIDMIQELPVAIDAGHAKALAEGHIARRWAERDKLVLRLPPSWLALEPGSIVEVEGAFWRAEQVTLEDLIVRVELSPVSEALRTAPADSGSHLPAPDVVAAPSRLVVLDLPDIGTGRHDIPVLQVAACQPVAGWRMVPLEVTVGGQVLTIGSAQGEAVIGTATSALAEGPSTGFDELNFVDVELADGEHWLESRDDEALGNGANLAALGSELIQFGRAIATGDRTFRLERLLRGRFGTEWAAASHGLNEAFVLIRPGALQEIVLPPSALGSTVSIRPRGLADDDAQPVECVVTGEAMRPPSPIELQAELQSDGALSVRWTRRSRLGWSWPNSTPPLGESIERYRITIAGSGSPATFETQKPQLVVSPEGLSGMTGSLTVTVVQLGDYAESRPATTWITI